MGWKEVAAGVGTRTAVSAIEAARGKVSKRQYKRLIATAVAQLLELHPDIGRHQAVKRARRITGAKPSKKLMRAAAKIGLREGAEAAVAAAATAGVAKVAGIVGDKLRQRFGSDSETDRGPGEDRLEGGEALASEPGEDGAAGH
jgi:plasmid stabilization system protein ParE